MEYEANAHRCGSIYKSISDSIIADMFHWMMQANSRLDYEITPGNTVFGGNPYLNPLFKRVRQVLGRD